MNWDTILGLYNYWIVIFLMMTGFYVVIARENLIKTVIGLNLFQTSVFLLYITMGKVKDGTAPIIPRAIAESHSAAHDTHHSAEAGHAIAETADTVATAAAPIAEHAANAAGAVDGVIYSNPLPSVLMLTAIVVGIATTAVALALVVRIREEFGTIDEDEILALDNQS
ncbi:putative monovalent cation/H+ antiporter subunit C [Roseimaritima multifibrata]|uniref:Putative monovalent cation/H+ antiporter subunit C n=1 Tax=Roseimaritima multifibrata TaxID=1930274 RepID=A0A517MB16_9BACT|nr:cation:proton antiporter subunit C [Roseimaritima multifibrata]QDS92079.1 putative monovalent cation/H+ antiporter subunit C [Roseimaritima multifibrata]